VAPRGIPRVPGSTAFTGAQKKSIAERGPGGTIAGAADMPGPLLGGCGGAMLQNGKVTKTRVGGGGVWGVGGGPEKKKTSRFPLSEGAMQVEKGSFKGEKNELLRLREENIRKGGKKTIGFCLREAGEGIGRKLREKKGKGGESKKGKPGSPLRGQYNLHRMGKKRVSKRKRTRALSHHDKFVAAKRFKESGGRRLKRLGRRSQRTF